MPDWLLAGRSEMSIAELCNRYISIFCPFLLLLEASDVDPESQVNVP
jgi:hypothetical protein